MTKRRSAIGVHHGHDAAIAILTDDGMAYEALERTTRVKHALGIDSQRLVDVIEQHPELDRLHLSSTQDVPVFFDLDALHIDIDGSKPTNGHEWFTQIGPDHHYHSFVSWGGEALKKYYGVLVPESVFGWDSACYSGAEQNYQALAMVNHDQDFSEEYRRSGSIRLQRSRRRLPLSFWQHHYLHAMYAAASVGRFEPSIIVTADGGVGPSYCGGGIYFFHRELGLRPMTPAGGWVGQFYAHVARRLGLGIGGAGKLMGLGPYGRPIYFDEDMVGTITEITRNGEVSLIQRTDQWLKALGFHDGLTHWDKNVSAPPIMVADIAASAQMILQINQFHLINAALEIGRKTGFEHRHLILSGGCALNCPSNSLIYQKYPELLVPPAVNDEGLAIGSAVIAWKEAYGDWPNVPLDSPYMGYEISTDALSAAAVKHGFVRRGAEATRKCVDVLTRGDLVAVAWGKSEVGPRALGHRSLIADPRHIDTWEKVNATKQREMWRPLAPFVAAGQLNQYFDGGPEASRYMLFNYRVLSKQFPAITHFDHSARVQTVDDDDQPFARLLRELIARNIPPVLLNTSLNGRGVPIAETEADVFDTMSELNVRYLYTGDALYERD